MGKVVLPLLIQLFVADRAAAVLCCFAGMRVSSEKLKKSACARRRQTRKLLTRLLLTRLLQVGHAVAHCTLTSLHDCILYCFTCPLNCTIPDTALLCIHVRQSTPVGPLCGQLDDKKLLLCVTAARLQVDTALARHHTPASLMQLTQAREVLALLCNSRLVAYHVVSCSHRHLY